MLTRDRLDQKDQAEREQHHGNDVIYAGQGRSLGWKTGIPPHDREVSQFRLTRCAALEAQTTAEWSADMGLRSCRENLERAPAP